MNATELKELREKLELTQDQLAKLLDVATNTVSRWELGERSIPSLLPLAMETIERKVKKQANDEN